MATARKRAQCDLTVSQKKEICEFKDKHAKSTQEQIAEYFSGKWSFHIARRTVGDVLKRKGETYWETYWETQEAHQRSQKHMRKPKFKSLEEALGMWFSTMQAKRP